MRQKHQMPRPQPQIQNHMPPKTPKLLPVVGRPEGKDKKEWKVITVLSDFYRPGAGHWAEPGVGRRDHMEALLTALGTSLLFPESHNGPTRKSILFRTRTVTNRSRDSPQISQTDPPKVGH